jgi:hypothetical protein
MARTGGEPLKSSAQGSTRSSALSPMRRARQEGKRRWAGEAAVSATLATRTGHGKRFIAEDTPKFGSCSSKAEGVVPVNAIYDTAALFQTDEQCNKFM